MNSLKTTLITFGFILLSLAGIAESEILFRSTFGTKKATSTDPWFVEDLSYDNWGIKYIANGMVYPDFENSDQYQTRMHGRYSIYINDPDTTISYAYAISPTFTNSADEYMIEFWFYVPESGVGFYHSYPICVPLNISGNDTTYTDAQLWVTPIKDPAYLQLTVRNSNDTISASTIDSLGRWYKLQLHRHDGIVDVYLMSVLKATITAENALKTNAIQIGTNKKNLMGEAYWDDFIVTTVPNGVHPRLYFNSSELANLRLRSQDNTPTVLGKSYAQIYKEDISDSAKLSIENPSSANIWSTWTSPRDTFIYPYYEPRSNGNLGAWNHVGQLLMASKVERVALASAITESTQYYEWLRPVLLAFSTWKAWSNPAYTNGLYPYAVPHECGLFTENISLIYDVIFNHLSNYEKMNAHNAIITLGLQQLDYQIVQKNEGPDFHANCKGGLGIGALVIDPPIREYVTASKEKMERELLNNASRYDPLGRMNPNGSYEYFAMSGTVKWIEAVTHSNRDILGLPDYYSTCPFLNNFIKARCQWLPIRNNAILMPTFYVDGNISRCDPSSVYLLSGKYLNQYGQYLSAKWPWPNSREYVPWSRFAWFNAGVDTVKPNSNITPATAFKGVGYTVLRSGWSQNDPVVIFRSGPRPCGHDHNDLNSFIYSSNKNIWFIMDDDGNGKDTKHHSTILVDHEGQINFERTGYADDSWSASRKGFIEKYYSDTLYSYSVGRAESLYIDSSGTTDTMRLNIYRRELILNNRNKVLAVNDYIEAKDKKRNIDWLLPCPFWKMYGDSVAIISGGDTLWCKLLIPKGVAFHYYTGQTIAVNPNPSDTAVAYARYLSVYFMSNPGSSHPVIKYVEDNNIRGAKVDNSYMMFIDSSAIAGTVSYVTEAMDGVENIVAGLEVNKNYRIVIQETIEGNTVDVIDVNSSEGGTVRFDFSPNNKPCKVTITNDFSSPIGSLSIGNMYHNFKFVELNTSASYPYSNVDSVNVVQKYWKTINPDTLFLPDAVGLWVSVSSGWLPYNTSIIQYLYDSEGNKDNIFEVQYKIGKNVLSSKYSANLYFNDNPPNSGTIVINDGALFTNKRDADLKVTGTDISPGLAQMRFAEKPFGNDSGYINLIKNGTFADTTNWILDNAEFYDGFLHLKGFNVGPGPTQYGSSARQIIPGSEITQHRDKLLRLSDDIYSHDVISSYKTVDVFYADTLYPNSTRLLERTIASTPEVVWKTSSDTFTLKADTARPLDRMEIGYSIMSIETPPPPPEEDPQFNTIAFDNVRLEPVLVLPVVPNADPVPPSYIWDGWDFVDTNYACPYTLSVGDGTKRVYLQLKDLPGNISSEPGWYDEIILDMTLPNSNITLPLTASYINGTVNSYGFSSDLNFEKWILDYKPYSYGEWQELTRSGVNQIDFNPGDLLYAWNTGTLHEGTYLLRLTTYDKASNVKADTHFVYVIVEPALPISAVTAEFATFNSLPVDATCDNIGNVYVTDTQADKIWKFSPEGDSLLCFGYAYTGQDTLGLNHPKGIAVDDSGNIWITDCYQSKVKKYDSQGNYLSTLGKHGNQQGEFNQPTGIAISGNEIYVVDHLNGRVQVFNKTGAFIRQFGNNCLNQPAGIAIRNNETEKLVYVCDSQNDRIAIFDTEGNLVKSLDSLGLDKPWDICFDNNNNLYIADVYNNRVIELDPWLNKLLTFGIQGQEAGQFKLPQGLAVSPDGKYLYVADTHNDRLQRFKMFFEMEALGGPQTSGKRQIANTAPTVYGLSQCYPNPSRQATNINYQIAKPGQVCIKVYNTLGQAVKTLVNENQQPGYYTINWDGRDESNRQVAAGIYFYRLASGQFNSTKKMVVLR